MASSIGNKHAVVSQVGLPEKTCTVFITWKLSMILWFMYTSIAILVLNLIINGPIFLAMHYYLWDSQTGSYTIAKIAQWVRILVSSFIIFSTLLNLVPCQPLELTGTCNYNWSYQGKEPGVIFKGNGHLRAEECDIPNGSNMDAR